MTRAEATRSPKGPVIGPMVMCGVALEEGRLNKLIKIEVKDSKLLSKMQREFLYKKIIKIADCKIVIIDEHEIDNAVEGNNGLNLNLLEANKSADIINELCPDRAYIDTPSPNIETYKQYLLSKLSNKNTLLVLEHKADLNYPVVSAASIIAKVTRDNEIEKIKDRIGIDFGSGYLTDPKTTEFLKSNYEAYPEIFRKSWSPYKELKFNKGQKGLKEFIQ